MNTAPIPKEILIHACRLKIFSGSGILGSRTLISETELSRVRIAVRTDIKEDEGGRRLCHGGTLYYDCVNSLPEEAVFLEDDCYSIIEWGGREYAVVSVKYIYGTEGLHHLEVELGGNV